VLDTQLRNRAAQLGADAVIIFGQSQSYASIPGMQTTFFAGNTAFTSGGAWGMSYPKLQGIAIKYL
jgi:hypothetical protein